MASFHSKPASPGFKDLEGRRFGRLLVLSYAGTKKGRRSAWWLCVCDCGRRGEFRGDQLISGHTTSCGCFMRERSAATGRARRTHGESVHTGYTTEYRSWNAMLGRCYNPRSKAYPNYGGRGITVCDRWRDSYEAFLADVGRKPGPAYSLDRVDNGKGYGPDNCRWATATEQACNTRRNVCLTAGGVTRTLSEWARATGISLGLIWARTNVLGWPPEDAVSRPVVPSGMWTAAERHAQVRARAAVVRAVCTGKLVRPATCSYCGLGGMIQAHHDRGYARDHWLDVIWLCTTCHARRRGT
jgi:hypothetical protein